MLKLNENWYIDPKYVMGVFKVTDTQYKMQFSSGDISNIGKMEYEIYLEYERWFNAPYHEFEAESFGKGDPLNERFFNNYMSRVDSEKQISLSFNDDTESGEVDTRTKGTSD